MIGYEGIQQYSRDYQFNISIGFRYRKSEILKNKEDYELGKKGSKRFKRPDHFKGERFYNLTLSCI